MTGHSEGQLIGHNQDQRFLNQNFKCTINFKVEAHLGPGTSRTLLLTDYM